MSVEELDEKILDALKDERLEGVVRHLDENGRTSSTELMSSVSHYPDHCVTKAARGLSSLGYVEDEFDFEDGTVYWALSDNRSCGEIIREVRESVERQADGSTVSGGYKSASDTSY